MRVLPDGGPACEGQARKTKEVLGWKLWTAVSYAVIANGALRNR
jgi:hypothetical protein